MIKTTRPDLTTILFDLDGTLTDPKLGITRCIQHVMERFGREVPEADTLCWCIGPPLRQSLGKLLQTEDPAIVERAYLTYRERFGVQGKYENTIYPRVVPALNDIRAQGYRMCVASSKPRVYVEDIVAHFRLAPFFDAIYGSELDGRLTQKEDLVAFVLATEHAAPRETLMVGDREHDILGGRKHGTWTAAVTYGYGSREELAAAGADFTFDAPDKLAAFLKKDG